MYWGSLPSQKDEKEKAESEATHFALFIPLNAQALAVPQSISESKGRIAAHIFRMLLFLILFGEYAGFHVVRIIAGPSSEPAKDV